MRLLISAIIWDSFSSFASVKSKLSAVGNFKTGCATVTIIPISIVVVNLPAVAMLGAAFYFSLTWLGAIAALFSIVYGLGILYAGSRLAGNLLLEREPELVATMKLPEE